MHWVVSVMVIGEGVLGGISDGDRVRVYWVVSVMVIGEGALGGISEGDR